MSNSNLSRRRFLSALGTGAMTLPLVSAPNFLTAATGGKAAGNILVMIELSGGNDGLNTVVPFTDPDYRGLRPEIGLQREELITLDRNTGLHGSMAPIADLWEDGAVRIVEGVGYPNPNRSHFRSIEIWNTGLGFDSRTDQGWISAAFEGVDVPRSADTAGLVLAGPMGPMNGAGRFSAMRDEEAFLETFEAFPKMAHAVRDSASAPTLSHILGTYESAQITGDAISKRLENSAAANWEFPWSDIGRQMRTAARLLEAGVEVPVLKMEQSGYDTHDAQPGQHANLLSELSQAIAAFATAMKSAGLWEQITILTYSEFGRTARENGSYGTDHGTAAPVFAIGGKVMGGFDGARPRLDRLIDDDLEHTTDYRALYAGVLNDLWGLSLKDGGFQPQSQVKLLDPFKG